MHKSISAVLIPENEECCIARCISSIYDIVDEIIVVDGGSMDSTVDIVKQFDKVKLFSVPFRHGDTLAYTKQRNLGISLVTSQWVLIIDPDEYLTYPDANDVRNMVDNAISIDAFAFRRHNTIDGQAPCSSAVEWKVRLFRNYCYYENRLHANVIGYELCERIKNIAIEHHKTTKQGDYDGSRYHLLYEQDMINFTKAPPFDKEWDRVIKKSVRCPVSLGVDMSQYTTLGVGGKLRGLAFPEGTNELRQVVAFAKDNGIHFFVIGNGSNMVIADGDIDALGIKLSGTFRASAICREDDSTCMDITVGSGTYLPRLSALLAAENITGFEFGFGIPATVGGAIVNNASCAGGGIADRLQTIFGSQDGEKVRKNDFNISYRHIDVPYDVIVAGFFTSLYSESGSEATWKLTHDLYRKKIESQPLEEDTAGSVFITPHDGRDVWELIDGAGLRGFAIGGAKVSDKHANFIVNTGNATAKDVKELISLIQFEVQKKYNVDLELELQVIDNHGKITDTWQ